MPATKVEADFRASYAERIGRAGAYIRAHLDQPMDLDRLAELACFSPWHFHRIYAGVTGETVAETYRRHRLHRAAVELSRGDRPVTEIARRAGFSAAASFIRAFSAAYGLTPGQFRRERRPTEPTLVSTEESLAMMDVDIITSPPITLAGLWHRGEYTQIGDAFERLSALAGQHRLFGAQTRMIGVYFDDPDVVAQSALRSFAGISIEAGFVPPAPLEVLVIAEGSYARAVHRGPYLDLHAFYRRIFRDWLPQSGREPADAPCFEDYLNNPATLPPTEWLTAVHVPLKS
jgi:AraC family transcriptional regulator